MKEPETFFDGNLQKLHTVFLVSFHVEFSTVTPVEMLASREKSIIKEKNSKAGTRKDRWGLVHFRRSLDIENELNSSVV